MARHTRYQWRKSFICTPIAGDASPGCEPKPGIAADYSIVAVKWFELRAEDEWGDTIKANLFTYPQLVNLRELLGYSNSGV